jgi:DNA mismatch repair protein MutS
VLARMGLASLADARPGRLSGGERRRFAVAAAVVRRPRVLLADEPTRGVAPVDAESVLAELRTLAAQGCAVVVTGHDAPAMVAAADRVVWVVDGATVAFASPAEARAHARFRAEVLPGEPAPVAASGADVSRADASRTDASPSVVSRADAADTVASHTDGGRADASAAVVSPTGASRRDASRETASRDGRLDSVVSPADASRPPASPSPVVRVATPAETRQTMTTNAPHLPNAKGGEGDGGRRMRVDRQTLKDLEVFEAPSGRGVFDVMDRTRTAGGRARLRRRWSAPMADAGEIAEVQAVVRFLADRPDVGACLPDEALMRAAEHHRRAAFAPVHTDNALLGRIHAAWWRMRRAAEHAALAHGLAATRDVLRGARAAALRLRESRPPAPLAAWADDVLRHLGDASLTPLDLPDASPLPAARVFAGDRAVREAGHDAVEAVVSAVHELDALASMGAATRELGLSMPSLAEGDGSPALDIDGAWHPFVERPVPNPLALDGDARLMFLTGPNMAGKTTYMRATALCAYLAQLGMGVPARAMRWTPFDALLTGLGTADDTRRGYSFFYAEVRRVKDAARTLAAGRAFVLFDEMFKGTNVRDALDASAEVVRALADCPRALCIVSSHLVELADALDGHPHVRLHCFDARLEEAGPVFDHRLKDGASAQRLGMVILRREGVLDALASLSDVRRRVET